MGPGDARFLAFAGTTEAGAKSGETFNSLPFSFHFDPFPNVYAGGGAGLRGSCLRRNTYANAYVTNVATGGAMA